MTRLSLVVLLLLIILLTSWIELKLNPVNKVEATTTLLYKSSDPQEFKEKVSDGFLIPASTVQIILSQEKSIQKLKELVQDLQKQLELCRAKTGNGVNDTTIQLAEFLNTIGHEWR